MHFIVNNTRGFQNFVFDTIPQNAQRAVKTFEELQPFRLITNNTARTICATVSACIAGILTVSAVVCVACKIFSTFKENGELVEENKVLAKKVAEQQQQNAALKSTIATTDAGIKTKDGMLASKEAQIAGLIQQKTELVEQMTAETATYQSAVEELVKAKASITTLEAQFGEERSKLENANKNLQIELQKITEQKTELEEQLAHKKVEIEREVAEFQDQRLSTEKLQNKLASEIREVRKSLETLEEKNSELIQQKVELAEQMAAKTATYQNAVEELVKAKATITTLGAQLGEERSKLENANRDLQTKLQKITTLKEQMADTQAEQENAKLSELEETIKTLRETLDLGTQDFQATQEQLEEERQKVELLTERFKTERASWVTQVEGLRAVLNKRGEESAQAEAITAAYEREKSDLQDAKQQIAKLKQTHQHEISVLEETIKKLEANQKLPRSSAESSVVHKK